MWVARQQTGFPTTGGPTLARRLIMLSNFCKFTLAPGKPNVCPSTFESCRVDGNWVVSSCPRIAGFLGIFLLPLGNQAWRSKILHLWVIFPATEPPLIWNSELPCLMTPEGTQSVDFKARILSVATTLRCCDWQD